MHGMGAQTMAYDAFISYSHATDGKFAPALQRALKSLAKPWYRMRALSVFRDETDLSAVPDLTAAIRGALAGSRFFVYLASPGAAQSRWVGEEIETWKRRNLPQHLLITLTEGEIAWKAASRDFDWEKSTALHPNLKGVFTQEPLWVDFRWAKSDTTLSSRDPRFQRATAMLAAPMHGKTLDELVGEDVKQHRRRQWLIGFTIGTLALLLVLFIGATVIATRSNTNLRSKLTLVDTVLPFFRVDQAEEDTGHLPAWRKLKFYLRDNLLLSTRNETWVKGVPERLALRNDCANPRLADYGGRLDCPKHPSDFDADGLRSDIPGLSAIASTLVDAIKSGRARSLLNESSGMEYFPEEGAPEADAEDDAYQELIVQTDILLPHRLWKSLPQALRSERRSNHFEYSQSFSIWRRTIKGTAVGSELIVIQLSHNGYCGSGGCDNPTLGFLRVGAEYALVFAEMTWDEIALYDAGSGNMPQIFSVRTKQSGIADQYRTISRLLFDTDCICYRAYLTGNVRSREYGFDQRLPSRLNGTKSRAEFKPISYSRLN
jgi:hypothetical protein